MLGSLQGLTPTTFWNHFSLLRETSANTLPTVLQSIIDGSLMSTNSPTLPRCVPIASVSGLVLLGGIESADRSTATIIVELRKPHVDDHPDASVHPVLRLHVPAGKAGQLDFLKALPTSLEFAKTHIKNGVPVRVAGHDLSDIGAGISMAILQELFDDNGVYSQRCITTGASTLTARLLRTAWTDTHLT